MKELSVNDMKSLELELLKNVATFCDDNNIRYYLCGGSLLGAVRHQGFIPWDDDMDIAMPRMIIFNSVNFISLILMIISF